MDQWTGRSINLLTGKEVVDLFRYRGQATVTDRNTAQVYEEFCLLVETLGRTGQPELEGEIVEELLFSQGGRKKGEWRAYVVKHG